MNNYRERNENLVRNLLVFGTFLFVFVVLSLGVEFQKNGKLFAKRSEPVVETTEIQERISSTPTPKKEKRSSGFNLFKKATETPTPTPEPTATPVPPTPTPTHVPTVQIPDVSIIVPPPTGIGGGQNAGCANLLNVFVFIDYNNDNIGASNEWVTGLKVMAYDANYNMIGQDYTLNGKASFCLPKKGKYYFEIPYLQVSREYTSGGFMSGSGDGANNLSFALQPPVFPVRLP